MWRLEWEYVRIRRASPRGVRDLQLVMPVKVKLFAKKVKIYGRRRRHREERRNAYKS